MKVLCSSCEAAEARVLCLADEAALCASCDRDVHAANRLAGKHQRLPLLAPGSAAAAAPVPAPPRCDICQECHGYFFCVEDRALLCRGCDVAVHTANAFVSAHRRFLVTGVQVSQEEQEDSSPDPPEPSPTPPARSAQVPLYGERDVSWAAAATSPGAACVTGSLPGWPLANQQFASASPRHAEAASRTATKRSSQAAATFSGQGGMMDWPLGEFFGGGFSNLNGGVGFAESGTSKGDGGMLGGGGSPSPHFMSTSTDDWNSDHELFGQVPEMQWSVPELPSPPTASGLHWPMRPAAHGDSDIGSFVPDVSSPDNSLRHCLPAGQLATSKRRRKW